MKAKVPNFQENSLASRWEQLAYMEQVEKWNEGFMEPLMDVKKENAKERGRRRKLLF